MNVNLPAYLQRDSFWGEPALVPPGGIPWWDKVLAPMLMLVAVVEVATADAMLFKPAIYVVGPVLVLTILFRRRHALAAFVIAFSVSHALGLIAFWQGLMWKGPIAWVMILLHFYSVFRWGSGRQAAAGLAVMAFGYLSNVATGEIKNFTEGVAGAVFLLFPAVVGVLVRLRAGAQMNALQSVRLGRAGAPCA